MKTAAFFFIAFSIILIILPENNITKSNKDEPQNIAELAIDGFEKPEDWEISFSKYRAKSFSLDIKEYLPSERWMEWIKADPANPKRTRRKILPPTIYRNPHLTNEQTILSIRADWDYTGTNWVALTPTNRRLSLSETSTDNNILSEEQYRKNKLDYPNYILLSGKVESIYCYMWGMGYDYTPEIYIQDFTGKLFIIRGPKLTFNGWRNVRFKIPTYAKQSYRIGPGIRPLRLLKIRIVSEANEIAQGFYTYLDYLHAKTDIYETPYFGDSLRKEKLK